MAGVAAMVLVVAGCGGDETSTESKTNSTPTVEETAPPATTSAGGATATPGARKLTTEQKQELLAKNNTAELGDGGPGAVASNYRGYAKPLAAGACKQALLDLATAEEAFGKAIDAGKPLAERKSLGQQVLKFKARVDSAC
jgi:hypothetical protein